MAKITAVVFVNKNLSWVNYAIEQIKKQQMVDWQLIVVNQGPIDTEIKRLRHKWPSHYFIKANLANRREAMNLALRKAKGEYFIVIPLKVKLSKKTFTDLLKIASRMSIDSAALINPFAGTKKNIPSPNMLPPVLQRIQTMSAWSPMSLVLFRTKTLKARKGFQSNLANLAASDDLLPVFSTLLELSQRTSIEITHARLHEPIKKKEIETIHEGVWAMQKMVIAKKIKPYQAKFTVRFDNSSRHFQIIPFNIASLPKVTILSAVYNEQKNIGKMLDSLALQIYPNLEVIIVDDSSTDQTVPIIRSFIAAHRLKNVKLIIHPINQGKAKAMNIGLKQATGSFILELDGDDWIDPDCVQVLAHQFKRLPPSAAYLYGNRRVFRMHGPEQLTYARLDIGRPFTSKYDFLAQLRPFGPRFYRKSALLQVGGWPTDYPSGGRLYEDFVLLTRLVDQFTFHYHPTVVYNIVRSSESITHQQQDRFWSIIEPVIKNRLSVWGNEYHHQIDRVNKKVEFIPNQK